MSTKQLLILVAVLLWSARGLAAGPSCDEDSECKSFYREGQLAHNGRKDFAAAIELYEAAYSRVPDPRLLVLIGRSQFKRGNVLQSLLLYNRARPDIDQPGDKAKLQLFIKEAEAALQRPTVTQIPDPASTQQTDPSTKESVGRARRLTPWRLGVGISFATLAVGLGSLVGGYLAARIAVRVNAELLRRGIVGLGVVLSLWFAVRVFR